MKTNFTYLGIIKCEHALLYKFKLENISQLFQMIAQQGRKEIGGLKFGEAIKMIAIIASANRKGSLKEGFIFTIKGKEIS